MILIDEREFVGGILRKNFKSQTLTDEEIEILDRGITEGGFIHVDNNYEKCETIIKKLRGDSSA